MPHAVNDCPAAQGKVGGMDLTITRLRIYCLSAPVQDAVAMSFAPMAARRSVLVAVETRAGLTGYGESWVNFPAWATQERRATLLQGVAPLVIGQDASRITALHQLLLAKLAPLGRQWGAPGPIRQAISGLDVALWDVVGKARGLSVAEMAGGRVREQVPAYASSLGPSGVQEQAVACRDAGFAMVKVKVGFGRDIDAANLRTARQVLGADVELLVDANQGWSLPEALAMAPVLQGAGVRYVEEPIAGDLVEDLATFADRTGLAVATGENTYGRADFVPYLTSGVVSLIQPDISKTGGLTEAVAICQIAEATRTPVAPHLYGGAVAFAATLQLAACMPGIAMIEYDIRKNPLRDPLLIDPPSPHSGTIELPAGPGLGIELNLDAVRERCEVEESYP